MFVAQGRAVFFAAYRASELGHTKTLDAGYALLSLDFHAVSFRCAAFKRAAPALLAAFRGLIIYNV
ncbi:MAG: hypothetical protein DMG67_01255 [Acidobacteria bacterium]|nr:MAG: hypothetical protein DMG67_01255 [Acidobacteriota bacterium]